MPESKRAMQVKLIVVGGKVNRTEVQLRLPAVLGRSREADLTLGHPSISRRHCRLREENGLVVVEDLQSTNGTFVEDRPVEQAALEPGARLRVGPLTFVVVYDRPRVESSTDEGLGEGVLFGPSEPQTEEESIVLASESPEALLPDAMTPAEQPASETPPEESLPQQSTPPSSESAPAFPVETPPPAEQDQTPQPESAQELQGALAEENEEEDEELRRFLEELQ